MKKFLVTGLVLIIVVNASIALYLRWSPRIEIDRSIHLGVVSAEKRSETITIPFRNRGLTQLNIQKVRTSCGCMSAEPSVTTLKYNQSGELTIQINISPGKKVVYVTLHLNDPVEPEVGIAISYEGKKWLENPPNTG